jgi:putative ABC transport system ATP-binding protein
MKGGYMTLIEVKGVTKIYREDGLQVKALDNINLTVEKGEFTAIVGPSGSGKTTLFNLIGTLDKPTYGNITVEGIDITKQKDASRYRLNNIGFVFQSFNLIPVFNVFENVEYPLLLKGVPEKERKNKVLEILKEVGILQYAKSKPQNISGGQQQRAAIARAIVSEPRVVLADELTAHLDSHTGANIVELLKKLNETKGITVLLSTHDPMVMGYAKRIIRLKDGRIEAS